MQYPAKQALEVCKIKMPTLEILLEERMKRDSTEVQKYQTVFAALRAKNKC